MSGLEIGLGIVLLIFCLAIIVVVLLQEGQQQQVGAVSGGTADTFFEKNKSRTIDAFLERWTKVIAIGFAIAVVVINAVSFF